MALSCRAQAFSVDNLLRASEKTTKAPEISSTFESVVFASQREFSKLHSHSWTASSRCLSARELLLANDESKPEHVLHSFPYGNSMKEFLLRQNQMPREELSTMGQYKRRFQDETINSYQFCRFLRNADDKDIKDVLDVAGATRYSSSADSSDAEEKDFRIRSPFKVGGTSRVPSSCFCHREMSFCNHPAVMTIADIGRSDTSIVAELCHADLWASFHSLGTEMIITKSGRRMFPALKLRITGLDPDKHYIVRLEFVQPDTRKYRYIYHSSRWMVSGSGDKLAALQVHRSPERSASGQAICSQVVSFERLKLTNSEPSRTGQVSLISMQKFQPQVVIQEEVQHSGGNDGEDGEKYVITFPQTSFMAVTAYQNQQVTTLKIASNPFAKGFRESGKTRIPLQSFATGLPGLLPCSTPASYFPGLMKLPTWPHCFQRDFDSNLVNDSCDTQSSFSGCDDLPAKVMKIEGNCRSNYLNCDTKKDDSSVDEAMYKSPVITARNHPMSHGYQHQRHQRDELKGHQHQLLSTQQLNIQALLHRSPPNSDLLQHIPVSTVDLINTPKDALQKLPIQMLTFTRSAHKSLNVKSEHPLNQVSNVYVNPTHTSNSHVVLSKQVFLSSESNSPHCFCTRPRDNGNIVVSPSCLPTPSVPCEEPNWTFTSGHSMWSRDSCILPLSLLSQRCVTEPTETDVNATVSRAECDWGI